MLCWLCWFLTCGWHVLVGMCGGRKPLSSLIEYEREKKKGPGCHKHPNVMSPGTWRLSMKPHLLKSPSSTVLGTKPLIHGLGAHQRQIQTLAAVVCTQLFMCFLGLLCLQGKCLRASWVLFWWDSPGRLPSRLPFMSPQDPAALVTVTLPHGYCWPVYLWAFLDSLQDVWILFNKR